MSATKYLQSGREQKLAAAGDLLGCLLREDVGQDLIEYALVFSFVGMAAVASLRSLTAGILNVFTAVSTALTTAT